MQRIAMGIEYDGSQYNGWQAQKDTQNTIQAQLEATLSKVANSPISIVCAGRTDARVHATNQVIHFDTSVIREQRTWLMGTNTWLPPSIRVLWAKEVVPDFHARHKAYERCYRYIIYNNPTRPSLLSNQVSWVYHKLDVEKMTESANYWLGQHDFSSFRSSRCQSKTPIRLINAIKITKVKDMILCDFSANAFLHHMIRNFMGVLIAIGAGKAEPIWAKEVLEARDRSKAGVTAAPNGLYLVRVMYEKEYNIPKPEDDIWFMQQEILV
jgi:tRNA pseudouridine38-40 synthase